MRPKTLTTDTGAMRVKVYEERSGRSRIFAFDQFPIASDIVLAMAEGFALSTGPGGTRRTLPSAVSLHSNLRRYAKYLSGHVAPPRALTSLRPSHLREIRLRSDKKGVDLIHSLRLVLRTNPDLPPEYRELLMAPIAQVHTPQKIAAYSSSEFRAIRRALRTTVRSTIERIRRVESELQSARSARASASTLSTRQIVLLAIADTGCIPRNARGESKYPNGASIARELMPSPLETASAALLLQSLTGQNIGTLLALTVNYQRADDQVSEDPLVLTRSYKPRRGRYLADMDVAFDSSDVWQDAPAQGRDALGQPAGVFQVVLEMCARTRSLAATDRLFCYFTHWRRATTEGGTGCRPLATLSQGGQISWTHLGESRKGVNSQRIRRSFISLRQRPVDHTVETMADTYLVREPTDLAESQTVVSAALADEVERIRTTSAVQLMTPQQVRLAGTDPEAVARELQIHVDTLRDLLSGQLDTVATACVSNSNSPYSPPGTACTASFLLCLGCPNSIAEPRHVPVLQTLERRLEARREEETLDTWRQRYGLAYEQTTDILRMLSPASSEPDSSNTTDDRAKIIDQLLDGKLELR
ncbi:hypothetical protein H4W26_000184 [Nesterenkonia halotolerans]|uniref:Core-binding (CB) domain-containing protein n=1 Tax=Nesterenkonia halotolerans TaxID=225325 RepID=A0ABR9J387_9MICC|nr:hypothetical protein [Nesterenkonia halotolerans]